MKDYTASLYTLLFELSRGYQNRLLGASTALTAEIQSAIDNTPKLFPSNVPVACQGVAGAYSQLACDKLFKLANIMYFTSFEAVFSAIESGLCRYGVLPLENSTAGSVNAIYDLMMKHDFRIVRSMRLKVDHNLLVKPGTRREDIREIFSHQQALTQCEQYLLGFPGVKITPCENTAMAAKKVAESDGHCAACDAEGIGVDFFQSNHEGAIVDAIQAAYGVYDGIVINPAAYTHTSVAILDALKAVAIPAVEVHISDVDSREPFRQISYAGMACVKTYKGLGFQGYVEAVKFLKGYLSK